MLVRHLEELVAREEVGGRLQDGRHGFRQLLVHRPGGAGRVWLRLEDKLVKNTVVIIMRILRYEYKIKAVS